MNAGRCVHGQSRSTPSAASVSYLELAEKTRGAASAFPHARCRISTVPCGPGILSWTETQMRKVQRTVCSCRVQLRPSRGEPRVALRKDGRMASAGIMCPTTGSSEFCGPVTRMADVMGRGERVQQAVRATALLERLPAGVTIARSIIGQWGPQQAMDCAGCPQGVAGSAGAMAMIAITRLATNLTRHLMLICHPLRDAHPWSVTTITRRLA